MAERYQSNQTVGYMRPPANARFRKGQSGNPRGRPRERATVAMMLAEELQTPISIMENGKKIRINKLRVLFKQAVNQAIAGNFRPLIFAVKMWDSLERLNRTATKQNRRHDPYKGIDLSKLSSEELTRMHRELLANSRPLDQY